MKGGQLVTAYHGCDVSVRDALVRGQLTHLKQSDNSWDWLGPGTYFFEDDPARALLFAQASASHPEKMLTKQAIATPAVVGALLCVGNCLDMTTQAGIDEFRSAYEELVRRSAAAGIPVPTNYKAGEEDEDVLLRQLDRAVFVVLHDIRARASKAEAERNPGKPPAYPPYDLVRGAFPQGEPVAPSSAFQCRSHIQLALRDERCVLGWFLLPGDKLLSDAELAQAKALLQAKNTARKPRVRATPASK